MTPVSTSYATVWVHVTTFMNWSRPPVGIVRVEQEYVRWLVECLHLDPQALGGTVRFCVFHRAAGHFTEVPLDAVEAKLRQVPAASGEPGGSASWKQRVKQVLRAAIPYLPPAWVPPLRAFVRRCQHQVLAAASWARSWLARRRERLAGTRAPAGPQAAFARGDRFVSLGLDWDTLDQKVLFDLKRSLELRTTLICYDVIPLLFPHLVVLPPGGFGAYFVDMAWTADALLCISEHTRRDCEALLAQLGVPAPPTHVIRLGAEVKGDGGGDPPLGLPHGPDERPFVLFVSTIERRKNHEILYRAWSRMRDQGFVPHRLVFVGMQGWGVNDLMNDLRLDPRVQDDIICLNHVSDAHLAWLYRHAAFTVFPSLYEGWGLPVVESLAWGRFCLASRAASIPEAGGEWAEYLDPWDLPAWTQRLEFFMRNPSEVQARNERINREFRPPAWAETAQAIHRVVLQAQLQEEPR